MTRDEYGDMIVGKTMLYARDFEDEKPWPPYYKGAEEKVIEKSETSFVLAEDHEEFMQTNVVPAMLEVVEAFRLADEEGMKKV